MGAVGHMRGADSAFLFVMAATDDKLLTPKSLPKSCTKHITCHSDNAYLCVSYRACWGGKQLWKSMSRELKALTALWDFVVSWKVRAIMCFYNACPHHNGLCFRPFQCLENVTLLFSLWSHRKRTWPGRSFLAFDRKLMILNVRLMHNEWDYTGCEGSASREHLGQTKMPFLPWDLCPGTRCH